MVSFINNNSSPILKLEEEYKKAKRLDQKNVEALYVSTINQDNNTPNSRLVNVKYIKNNKIYFFSNYNSQKAKEIESNQAVSCIFFWNSINCQIRIKGDVSKISSIESDKHFNSRAKEKNILAIISKQSEVLDNYNTFTETFKHNLENLKEPISRPNYWGGYEITPYYFEFWNGHEFRLNKREVYENNGKRWLNYSLYP